MSGRLDARDERQALALLEDALDEEIADPEAFIRESGEFDRVIRERALALLRATESSGASLRTGGVAKLEVGEEDGPHPDRIGDYDVIGLLGRGGMGAVYKAKRESDFDHEVAIKVIKPGVVTPALKDRFRRERQILAGMRHPNIAQFFDGGETEEGSPFIVMELVEGRSLTRWLRDAKPSVNERLALFLQICDAVEFAHRNLIVHRDLTPGNVLVTDRNVAKLIDFGIARPQTIEDAAPTHSPLSNLSLTPGFAAPERHAGAPVNTLADIYSLGKILGLMIESVAEPELSAIAARATADRQQDRYPGATILARDVRNFLEHLPVEAYSDARSYRARKYFERHRLPVVLAGIAGFLLLAGLIGVTTAYRAASIARDEAEQRFSEVRDLSNFLLFDLYDELVAVPGTTQALNDIADRARHYLDALSTSRSADPELRLEAALAYKRLADVLGTPIAANLGRREEAGEMLAVAIRELRALHEAAPDDEAVTRGLASALYSQAVFAFISLDDNEQAHKAGKESAALYWKLAETFDREKYSALAIDAEIEAAQPLAWIDRGGEGVEMLEHTLTRARQHVGKFGRSADNLGLLARTLSALSETVGRAAGADEADYAYALEIANQAVPTYREYVAASDRPAAARRSLAASLYKRSLILYQLERDEAALADLDEAISIISALAERDPDDMELVRNLAAFSEQKAVTLAYAGRGSEAIALARSSNAAKRAASDREPDNPGLLRDLGSNLLLVGEVAEVAGAKGEACRAYREGEATYARLERLNGLSDHDRDYVRRKLSEALARSCGG